MEAWPDRHAAPMDGDARRGPAEAVSYPRELEREVVLNDEAHVRIRPVRPDDEPGLSDLYARLSEHTAYQRFFTVLRRLPADWFHAFANVDYRRRLALVAEGDGPAGPELVGVGRYEPTEDADQAELAFVVQDRWQGHGLGAVLLHDVIDAALARGVRRFRAFVLADNHRMMKLLATRMHVEHRHLEDGVVELELTPTGAAAAPR